VKWRGRLKLRVLEKGPGGGSPSASGVEGRCPTPIGRGTRGAAGCRTPEMDQAPDWGRLAINVMKLAQLA